jgi:hypothetical protein
MKHIKNTLTILHTKGKEIISERIYLVTGARALLRGSFFVDL